MAALSTAWTRIYTNLVVNGRWTIEQVPAAYQEAVKAAISAQN